MLGQEGSGKGDGVMRGAGLSLHPNPNVGTKSVTADLRLPLAP